MKIEKVTLIVMNLWIWCRGLSIWI